MSLRTFGDELRSCLSSSMIGLDWSFCVCEICIKESLKVVSNLTYGNRDPPGGGGVAGRDAALALGTDRVSLGST